MAQPKIIYRERTPEELEEMRRISRERDAVWSGMERDYPRAKAEHPDMWVAFSKDGLIAANDDLFALVAECREKGYTSRQMIIEFTHVSIIPLWGAMG